uniref:SCP domain-containing protein n=3 Tax=Neognathae TaxID=8825 RepID=A0A803Y1P9_MELGA
MPFQGLFQIQRRVVNIGLPLMMWAGILPRFGADVIFSHSCNDCFFPFFFFSPLPPPFLPFPCANGALFCQVWDETLAKSAEAWAATCIWDHGPSYLLRFLGQNLSVRTGRYRSILQLVKPWYDEVKDYAFPYPQDCNPRCPMRCYGPMCTHYTQMVWATSNRIGCAIHTCHNMNVWGSVWRRAVYLVCNYAPKGNWIGEAPYKVGVPCSACPPSYGGSCTDNLCFPGVTSNYLYWFK